MTTPAGLPPLTGLIDIVTVAYRRESDMLRLQAQSIDRFFDPAGLGRILVLVNDVDEDACVAELTALIPAYGRFADRVEILRPAQLFALRPENATPHGLGATLRDWFTANRQRYPFGVKTGWRGNRGWSAQQALKMAVARHATGDFLLILDAKNHFIKPVSASSFISPAGKARSYFIVPDALQSGWIAASFAKLGVPPEPPGTLTPPTVTPFPTPRAALLACLEEFERRFGPVETFFCRKKTPESEFMLLHAHVTGQHGSWGALFDPGLIPAATIFRLTTDAEIAAALAAAESGEAEMLSIHSSRLGTLTPADRQRIEAIWADRGLDGLKNIANRV